METCSNRSIERDLDISNKKRRKNNSVTEYVLAHLAAVVEGQDDFDAGSAQRAHAVPVFARRKLPFVAEVLFRDARAANTAVLAREEHVSRRLFMAQHAGRVAVLVAELSVKFILSREAQVVLVSAANEVALVLLHAAVLHNAVSAAVFRLGHREHLSVVDGEIELIAIAVSAALPVVHVTVVIYVITSSCSNSRALGNSWRRGLVSIR
jgi:hypothetical protein